jgi:hypothetical protein
MTREHINRMLEWKIIGTRITGRSTKRWIVDIEEDNANNGNKTVERGM